MTTGAAIRTLEVAAIVASWPAAALIFRRVRADKASSLSRHGGSDRTTYVVFGCTLTLHAVVFAFFCLLWLIPTLKPAAPFTFVMLIAATCQALTGWIRDAGNPLLRRWHGITAYTMSVAMPIMIVLIIAGGHLSRAALVVNWMALITMTILLLILLKLRSSRTNYLWYQSAYILSFQLAIIAIAVTG